MREIKFRAWWKEQGTMIGYDLINNMIEGKKVIIEKVNPRYIKDKDAPFESHIAHYIQCNPFTAPELIIMQFTGLKDKNGKDIYEGDVLRVLETFSSDDPAYPYYCDVMEVIYAEAWAAFGLTDGGASPIKGQVEVIGNIYENPELIK